MRPPLRTSPTGSLNHANINALRRWTLDAYNIRYLRIYPTPSYPDTRIVIYADLAAMRSVGGEVAIRTAASTPAFGRTLFTDKTGVGGLDTGKLASNSLYAIYLVADTASENGLSSNLGVIASTDWQNPALPAGWTHKRLVGAFATKEDESTGEAVIVPFTQLDDWFIYSESQVVLHFQNVTEAIKRTPLDIANWMPPVSEEVHVDAQVIGGNAPFSLKIYEHHTGLEILDLNPGTGDFGHESVWMFAPRQILDYSVGVNNTVWGEILVLGFRIPINQEF